ncbi:MAG: hypothetical protein QOC87_289, partial [Actinomycetota bacterium]|nr:hypothetical protein [Actinomycetota bacterium]
MPTRRGRARWQRLLRGLPRLLGLLEGDRLGGLDVVVVGRDVHDRFGGRRRRMGVGLGRRRLDPSQAARFNLRIGVRGGPCATLNGAPTIDPGAATFHRVVDRADPDATATGPERSRPSGSSEGSHRPPSFSQEAVEPLSQGLGIIGASRGIPGSGPCAREWPSTSRSAR